MPCSSNDWGSPGGSCFASGQSHDQLLATAVGLQLLEEIVALVIHQDERREIDHLNFPDRFHAEFGVFQNFNLFDIVLGQDSCGATNAAEIEAAMLLAGIGNGL